MGDDEGGETAQRDNRQTLRLLEVRVSTGLQLGQKGPEKWAAMQVIREKFHYRPCSSKKKVTPPVLVFAGRR